jgi:hypothetical protein
MNVTRAIEGSVGLGAILQIFGFLFCLSLFNSRERVHLQFVFLACDKDTAAAQNAAKRRAPAADEHRVGVVDQRRRCRRYFSFKEGAVGAAPRHTARAHAQVCRLHAIAVDAHYGLLAADGRVNWDDRADKERREAEHDGRHQQQPQPRALLDALVHPPQALKAPAAALPLAAAVAVGSDGVFVCRRRRCCCVRMMMVWCGAVDRRCSITRAAPA